MKEEILKAFEEDTVMDFIASNYHKLSKEELKIILLEVYYKLYQKGDDNYNITIMLELEERL